MALIALLESRAEPRERLAGVLCRAGHEVKAAADARTLAASLLLRPVDVVVLAGEDGSAGLAHTARVIRQQTGCRAPILALTAGDGACDELDARVELRLPDGAGAPKLIPHAVRALLEAPAGSLLGDQRPVLEGYRPLRRLGPPDSPAWLALRLADGAEAVVKLLPLAEHDEAADAVQRLIHESVLLAQVDHPGVVKVIEQGFSPGHAWLATEYLPGGELRTLLGAPLPRGTVAGRLAELAAALGAVHESGIVHGDVKPENVLRARDGRCVLVDFGIARQEGVQLARSAAGRIAGTPGYLAPEHTWTDVVDHRADLYSLGVVLHEMLVGAQPFTAASADALLDLHLRAPVPPLPAHARWARSLVDGLLAKDPEARFQTADEVLACLAEVRPEARPMAGAA